MPLPISLDQARNYIYRPAVLHQWLGTSAVLLPKLKGFARLPDATGDLWSGTVVQATDTDQRHEVTLAPAFKTDPAELVNIRITARPNRLGCRIRISVSGFADDDASFRQRLLSWQAALVRLDRMVRSVVRDRVRPRQALIIVHGMGEQLPGETLADFTSAIFPSSTSTAWSKPDYTSPLFEMRKLTVNASDDGTPTTDVYELYWAHLMRDTTFWQVAAWALRLIFLTKQGDVPKGLRSHLWVIRLVMLVAGVITMVTVGNLWPGILEAFWPEMAALLGLSLVAAVLSVVAVLVLWLWKWFKDKKIVDVLGDVPHYLEPKPANIDRRQAIRDAGVDLLEALHTSGQYDKIIVFGHSLGSVIAYDILTFGWIRFGRVHRSPGTTRGGAMYLLESYPRDCPDPQGADPELREAYVAEAQQLQQQAWVEYRRNGMPWLVTDFVTAGSPLTHAELLLRHSKTSTFQTLKSRRVFPTCPPVSQMVNGSNGGAPREAFSYARAFRDLATGQRRTVVVPDHAAPFALTRWTNLFFPFGSILRGDPVSGPLASRFGEWIRDRELPHPHHPHASPIGLAHTLYWDASTESVEHIAILRESLRLDDSSDLTEISRSLPLFE